MPPPIPVKLLSYDERWPALAGVEIERIRHAAGGATLDIHHIGSTSIPGIAAKPTLDLLGVAPCVGDLDQLRKVFRSIGYEWHGEFGFPGRRYLTRTNPVTSDREVNLHCYARGDPAVERHLAFRDYLRARPDIADAYERIKQHCAARHPDDSHAYTACKDSWIKQAEADALAAYRRN